MRFYPKQTLFIVRGKWSEYRYFNSSKHIYYVRDMDKGEAWREMEDPGWAMGVLCGRGKNGRVSPCPTAFKEFFLYVKECCLVQCEI